MCLNMYENYPVVLTMIHAYDAFIRTCVVNSWLDKSPQQSELFDSKTSVLSAACNAPTVLTEISQITNKPMNSFDTNFCLKLKLLTSFETLIRETSQLCWWATRQCYFTGKWFRKWTFRPLLTILWPGRPTREFPLMLKYVLCSTPVLVYLSNDL